MSLQPSMHERTPAVRGQPSLAVRASRTAIAFFRDNARVFAVAVVAGVFLSVAGAFGTDGIPAGPRFTYWIGVLLLGSAVGAATSEIYRAAGWLEERAWLQGAAIALTMSLPLTLLVAGFNQLAFGHRGNVLFMFVPVLLVSACMTAINMMVARQPQQTHAAPAGAAPPRFLERLPPKLRGAEIWAVESQDHYLRLHTSKGQDLILMRLSDAVAELEGLEGAQTHRSWWVAKDAVTDAKRGDGRATLTLKGGAQAPVSRAYAKALRDAGWY